MTFGGPASTRPGLSRTLIDVFNNQLNVAGHASLDVTNAGLAIHNDYLTDITPPRLVLHELSTDIPTTITGLRSVSGSETLDTQYCWVAVCQFFYLGVIESIVIENAIATSQGMSANSIATMDRW
ncbi:hypothetical protein DYB25_011696 [Aphanomyces astaci]|uniref:Uncharacterized protein n=1 Tax=Aphanomyces astaci TaxID=112090 RepID=A0A397AH62_APHAT|nr:hypothetical protein DYB25_011696 [Aphanomyces astaci]RHY16069.1 hypothetical protein DYB36_005206 [Aphanomyces astaci]RHY58084.1 hypothetical protein DYB34_008308 [Aphanomyces astaci]RHY63038.1 hypothetical protein DYB38_002621 [Aphanomyces astaci]RHY78303.1 hypothetical protein DYB30_007178 [Aphanomyces astaci]